MDGFGRILRDLEGIYTFQGFSDGMDYWVDAQGVFAIWYKTLSLASEFGSIWRFYRWGIGYLSDLGSTINGIWLKSSHLGIPCKFILIK